MARGLYLLGHWVARPGGGGGQELLLAGAGRARPDVRRAYKKRTLQLNSGKNPNAKDKKKRELYYKVLVEVLPNWKSHTLGFLRL